MKAIVNRKYGTTSELKFEDVDKPTPKDGEVLVQVHATTVNSWDWDVLKGSFFNRLIYGPLKPKINVLGCDVAGVVSEVGNAVNRFKPGDEVFGDISSCGWGGFAEFVAADENALAIKPASMTFEQAAAVPSAVVTALQALRNKGHIESGQNVLINGAS